MNKDKLFFWIPTVLVSILMLFSAGMYLFNFDEVSAEFVKLGFPVWIIKPLAIAKLLGVAAILTRANKLLMEWAYAGFFFDFVLALSAHLAIQDGDFPAAVLAIVLVLASRYGYSRAFGKG